MEDVNNSESGLDTAGRHPPSSLLNKFSAIFVRDKTDMDETAVLTSFRPLSEEESHIRPLSYSLFDSDHDRLKESGGFYNSPRVSDLLLNPTERRKDVESWEIGSYSQEQCVDEPSLSGQQEEAQFPSSLEGADPDLVEVTMVEVYSDTEQEDEETGRSLGQSERRWGFRESLLRPPVVEEPVNDKSDQEQKTDSRCDDVIESNSSSERPVPSTAESLEERSVKGSSVLDRARSKDTAADWGVQDLPVALRWKRRCSPVSREDIRETSAEDTEHASTDDMGSEVSAARAWRRRPEASKVEVEAKERRETEQPEASEGDPLLILSGTSAKLSLTNRKKASSAVPVVRDGGVGEGISKARETSEGRDGGGQEPSAGLPDSADCQPGQRGSSGSSDTKGFSEATEGPSPADKEPSATSPRPQQGQDTPAASGSSIPLADQSPSPSSTSSASSPASRSNTLCPFSSSTGERSFQVPALFSGLRVFKKGAVGEERESVSEIRQRDGDRALLNLKQHVNKAKLFPEHPATSGSSSISPTSSRRRPETRPAPEGTGLKGAKERQSLVLEPEGDAKSGEQEEGGSDASRRDTEKEGTSEGGTAVGDQTADTGTANAPEDSGAGGSAKASETAFSLGAFKSFFTPKSAKKDGEENSVDVEAVKRKRRSEKELLKSIFERAGKSPGSDLKGSTETKVCIKDGNCHLNKIAICLILSIMILKLISFSPHIHKLVCVTGVTVSFNLKSLEHKIVCCCSY